jgi:Asp-tRNA(Asn)/Glu-tRNA(Gln) amidotransferase C subunit
MKRLADLAGISIPAEDLAPLAEALAAFSDFVEPLLRADLSSVQSALTFDPRWDD